MDNDVAFATPIVYYKRYRMEIALTDAAEPPALPEPYRWLAWRDDLLDLHAEVNYRAFRSELDSDIFPCLGDRDGCKRLMREIRRKPGFLPAATWLVGGPKGCVGTIQSVIDGHVGSIQNVGVIPGYRGLGLGTALVRQALAGFRANGLAQSYLEVTADNSAAVRMYAAMGFRKARTTYRAVCA